MVVSVTSDSVMDRRTFIDVLAGSLLAAPLITLAQPTGKVRRLGMLSAGTITRSNWAPFLETLREFGWIEGQNLLVELRAAEGKAELVPALAAELVELKVDVIVATGAIASLAAKNATTTIPIVSQSEIRCVSVWSPARDRPRSCRCARPSAYRPGPGQVGDHGDLGLAFEVVALMAQEAARQVDVEPGLAHQHGSPDRIGAVEAGDLLLARRGRRGDLEAARIGIDFEARELAVEGVEVGGCGAVVLLGLGLVAERLVGAAEPIVAARVAERPVGSLGQRLEMAERQLGVLEVAQRQPSRKERRVLGGIDGERPGIAHQVVGHLRACRAAAPRRRWRAAPPTSRPACMCPAPSGSASRIFQASSSFFWRRSACAFCTARPQSAWRVRGQLGQELLRILGAQEDGKARLRLLLLVLGQQRDDAADDGRALVALAVQRLSLSSSRSSRRLWSASVEQRADAAKEGRAPGQPGISSSVQAFCASALAFASSFSAR